MFDAARAALLSIGDADSVLTIKSHSGLISAFSLKLVKVGKLPLDLGKSLNKVEDLRLMGDYKGDLVEEADAAWAVQQATIFVDNLSKSFE